MVQVLFDLLESELAWRVALFYLLLVHVSLFDLDRELASSPGLQAACLVLASLLSPPFELLNEVGVRLLVLRLPLDVLVLEVLVTERGELLDEGLQARFRSRRRRLNAVGQIMAQDVGVVPVYR